MYARILVLLVILLTVFSFACADSEGEEIAIEEPTASLEEFQSPTPTALSTEAAPSETPVSDTGTPVEITPTPKPEITQAPEPTPLPDHLWGSCLGMVQEEGDELVAVGERYCIVEKVTGTFVSIWPESLETAPAAAQEAAEQLSDPCGPKVSYFFGNLPDLGFPKIVVKDYVCGD